ncbi:MAG: histidine kinase [Flavobacteriaceae bacterium]|nr:histidine kinase [Flavobacteriaceae bacterium]|tara:strand:+ start:344 stop:820 length:477 start_codon:yes stop_codon:yes gene_type:complete
MIFIEKKLIIKKIKSILSNKDDWEKKLFKICDIIKYNLKKYDWVGFYFSDLINKQLKLIAFSGEETEHTIIPFGRGVCGQVANSNKPLIIPDVKSEKNYISCNINVKSEIVVPILIDNINIGQIDVDSNTINAFSNMDKIFLEEICELVSKNYDLNKN